MTLTELSGIQAPRRMRPRKRFVNPYSGLV
jgi:hypothetical protein